MMDAQMRKQEAKIALQERSRQCIKNNCQLLIKSTRSILHRHVPPHRCVNPSCYNYRNDLTTTIYCCLLCGKKSNHVNFQGRHIKSCHPKYIQLPTVQDDDDDAFIDFSTEEANNDDDDSCMSHPSLKKPKIEPFYPHSLITASEFLRSLKPIILPDDPETRLEKQCQIMAKCFPRPNDTHRRITESIGNKKKDRYKTKSGHENLSILSQEEFFSHLFTPGLSAGRLVVQNVLGKTASGKSNSSSNESCSVSITEADALFHVMMCKLYHELTDEQMENVIILANYARYRGKKLSLPTSLKKCRHVWHRKYERSIHKNLPIPEVVMPKKGNGYSYLSLEDIIRRNMATLDRFPRPFSNFKDSPHGQSARGTEWLLSSEKYLDPIHNIDDDSEIYKIKVIIWSDGARTFWFKDSSVHICTATIGAPDGDHSGLHTYPIWIGPSKESPVAVERIFIDELNRLQKGQNRNGDKFYCFHAKRKCMVRVQVCPFAWIADRPKKGVQTGTLTGRKTHQCFMLGLDPNKISDGRSIVSCEECMKLLYDPMFTNMNAIWNRKCSQCRCFNLNDPIPYHAPQNYPEELCKSPASLGFTNIPKSPGIIYSHKITFSVLKNAMDFAYEMSNGMMAGRPWSNTKADCYIAVRGGHHGLASSVSDQAGSKRNVHSAISSHSSTNPINQGYIATATRHEQYKKCHFGPEDFPPVWSLDHFGIENFVSALAHQLFLGIQKMICGTFLASYVKLPNSNENNSDKDKRVKGNRVYAFSLAMEICLKKVEKLKLSHLQVNPKVNTSSTVMAFSGWKSKEFLTFCKLQRWIISYSLETMCRVPENDIDDTIVPGEDGNIEIDFDKLNEISPKIIKDWCRRRNINTAGMPKGKKNEQSVRGWFHGLLHEHRKEMFSHFDMDDILAFTEEYHPSVYQEIQEVSHNKDVQRYVFLEYLHKNFVLLPEVGDTHSLRVDQNTISEDMIEIVSLYTGLVSRIMGDDASRNNLDDIT